VFDRCQRLGVWSGDEFWSVVYSLDRSAASSFGDTQGWWYLNAPPKAEAYDSMLSNSDRELTGVASSSSKAQLAISDFACNQLGLRSKPPSFILPDRWIVQRGDIENEYCDEEEPNVEL
jgi:hypothetical protein